MTDSVRASEGTTIVLPDGDADAPTRHRTTFVEPHPIPSVEAAPAPPTDEQEHRPVTTTLSPEAPTDLLEPRAPRPVSVPSHRADVDLDVVPTDPAEPRPASVARHSVDTSAITLPVFAQPVDPSLPQPPERVTLDDDVLVRMVERRLDDTATVDLMAVVQAQLQARRAEAAQFATWADAISRVGTDEAAEVLERTRLRFTGVIDVVLPPPLEAGEAPVASLAEPQLALGAGPSAGQGTDPGSESASAVVTTADVPVQRAAADDAADDVDADAEADRDELTAPSLLPQAALGSPRDVGASPTAVGVPAPEAAVRRPVVLLVGAAVASLVVLVALVLAAVVPGSGVAGVLATVAVPLTAGLVGTGTLLAVRARGADAELLARRGPVAVVAAVVVASVVGLSVLTSSLAALAWQGWLLRAVGATGVTEPLSALLAVVLTAVVAVVVTVVVTSVRATSRD
ncbi:hypothetical protein EDF38_1354 [Frigoribacterium sp. PhB160]|uniref:hypothetical protein n=1 Tax=Frigoribacterium sp. PhB160 TaxID=2485192 RepID=UPI000F4746DC|nr:hypothetical protein [Frigoribacterium sp. PhB160]ROS62249.1 hypothetical protein EDF38_1354 [Frigoribacterium sp. PhB160]